MGSRALILPALTLLTLGLYPASRAILSAADAADQAAPELVAAALRYELDGVDSERAHAWAGSGASQCSNTAATFPNGTFGPHWHWAITPPRP